MKYETILELMSALKSSFDARGLIADLTEHAPYGESAMASVLMTLTEHMSMSTDIYTLGLEDGKYLLQMFSILAVDLPDGPLEELNRASEYLNLYSPLGLYGIVREDRQFFFRYTILLQDGESAGQVTEKALSALEVIFDAVSVQCPLLTLLISGKVDCRTALEKGYFLNDINA
jgi:hypothetical protein